MYRKHLVLLRNCYDQLGPYIGYSSNRYYIASTAFLSKGEYSVRKRKPRVWGKNKLQPKKGEKGEEISPKDKGNFKQKIACFYVTSN